MADVARKPSSRVALVEDHSRLSGLVKRGLAGAGIAADTFSTVEAAWYAINQTPYIVAIVDRGLPDGDGLELVRRMRAARISTPCLMLTARDALRDRVDGLDAGADDYLAKPFALEELVARVRALMRRPVDVRDASTAFDGVVVIPESSMMGFEGVEVALAPAELQIMICLVRAEGQAVRRAALEAAAWGLDEAVTPNALDVALHRLRRKLHGIKARLTIENIRNVGFALKAPDAA
jgi:DNA-binding response OmpR family regulator